MLFSQTIILSQSTTLDCRKEQCAPGRENSKRYKKMEAKTVRNNITNAGKDLHVATLAPS